jgi:hypothetical protein
MWILIITLIRENLKKIELPIKISVKSEDQTERILEKTITRAKISPSLKQQTKTITITKATNYYQSDKLSDKLSLSLSLKRKTITKATNYYYY